MDLMTVVIFLVGLYRDSRVILPMLYIGFDDLLIDMDYGFHFLIPHVSRFAHMFMTA